MVSHAVVVQQIALDRLDKLSRASVFKSYTVIYPGIVYQSVQALSNANRFLNGTRAILGNCKLRRNHMTFSAGVAKF